MLDLKKNLINFINRSPSYNKALNWIIDNSLPNNGIVISSGKKHSYPEVTGYTIPTLYQWGEKELAEDLTVWLICQQNNDGSFSAPDGTPYTFDTGQVVRGFLKALDDLSEVEKPLRKACGWIIKQVRSDGRLETPSTKMWGNIADERIHLYVLPPLIEAGEKLNEKKYLTCAKRVLQYYLRDKNLLEFNTLSHFYGYIIEALCDLGEKDLAKRAARNMVKLQKRDGSIPAYQNVSWVCSPGVAQFAVIWFKLGMQENAQNALRYLENIQNNSGGFYGSYGKGNYFPKEEISWTNKFFLDAYYWKIKTSFNIDCGIFPSKINSNDGRVKELLNFLGNNKKQRILDIGCGKGRFLRILAEKYPQSRLYGVDISEKMLKYCPTRAKTKIGSILNIPYSDGYFNRIYCIETLEHAIRIEAAVTEMLRVLKPGGKILIIDKNINKLGRLKLSDWEQWFDPQQMIKMLKKYCINVSCREISYENTTSPDGLFLAWEGVKK